MELRVTQETASINEILYDGSTEHPIECDFVLPDYCPDIVRILNCCLKPGSVSKQLSGTSLSIDGSAVIEIMYVAPDEEPRLAIYRCPFNKTIELKNASPDAQVMLDLSTNYVNCRAVSQRRLDIRGAMKIHIQVQCKKQEEILCDAQGAGMQLKKRMLPVTDLKACICEPVSIHEDLELPSSNPPMVAVLHTSVNAAITDCKLISGKIIVKGELHLSTLYICDRDSKMLACAKQIMPFSQMIDVDAVDEDCLCDVWIKVLSCEVTPREDFAENTGMILDCELEICATIRKEQEITCVCDAFSTLYECGCEHKTLHTQRILKNLEEHVDHVTEMNLPQPITEVLDSWCDAAIESTRVENEKAMIRISAEINLIAYDEEHHLICISAKDSFDHECELDHIPENLMMNPHINVLDCNAVLSGTQKADVKILCDLGGEMIVNVSESVIDRVSAQEEQPVTRDKDIALTIYYADPGEQVWEIAKRYHTSVEQILSENELASDKIEKRGMLLIPIVTE